MKRPFYQVSIIRIGLIISGILAFGAVLGAINDAGILITPCITYFGSGFVVLSWVLAELWIKRYRLAWVTKDKNQAFITKLGDPIRFGLVGILVLLWVPRFISPAAPTPVPIIFTIHANRGWQNTTIEVSAGDVISIKYIAGTWKWTGDIPDFDGDGDLGHLGDYRGICTTRDPCPKADAPLSALVGKIGNNGQAFLVGNHIVYTVPDNIGEKQKLYLMGNDVLSGLYDNEGAIHVEISVSKGDFFSRNKCQVNFLMSDTASLVPPHLLSLPREIYNFLPCAL